MAAKTAEVWASAKFAGQLAGKRGRALGGIVERDLHDDAHGGRYGMTVSRYSDLPLADRARRWTGSAAEKRVRKWAGAEDGPNAQYRKAHLWYDAENEDNFTAYKLLIADVVDGRLVAVPRAISAAAGIVDGARGGLDVPNSDLPKLRRHLARYYTKMDDTPPWT